MQNPDELPPAHSEVPPPESDADQLPELDRTISSPTDYAPSPTPVPPLSALRQNLNNAFRIAFFVRVPEQQMPVSLWQAMCFAFLSMTVPVIWALVVVGDAGEWNLYALPAVLFHIPVLLFAAALIAYAIPRLDQVLAFFQAFLMIGFVIDLVYYTLFFIFYRLPDGFEARAGYSSIYYGCAIWMAFACAVAATRLAGAVPNSRAAPLIVSMLLIALPLSTVYRDRSLWEHDYSKDDAAPAARNDITAEDNFYRQPEILEHELAAVLPQRKGIVDVYFIGMAGYGNQDVFRREVDSVSALFRERFDADGRTVRLINNPKLAASAPVASVTSLAASLQRVAQQMDKDEDVLVLFLTSHGSQTHRFSLDLWPLQFKELDPATLRSLLDESGIKHRVVVISACYSGGFVDALKDDDTLVITASAPDRNSFGCSNENEWTYFGKAYFDEALRTTTSFTKAFEIAKPVIAERETAQKYTASNPQMAVGKNIVAKLERLQFELANPKSRDAIAVVSAARPENDAAARYAALRYDRDTVAHQVSVCKATAHAFGPDVVITTQPNAYGGLNPDSPLWPRLVGSWKRYVDNVCDRTRDPIQLQTTYAQFLRDAVSADELDVLLRFVETPTGKRWLKADKAADRSMTGEITRMQSENQASLYKIFMEEQQDVLKAFREKSKAKQ